MAFVWPLLLLGNEVVTSAAAALFRSWFVLLLCIAASGLFGSEDASARQDMSEGGRSAGASDRLALIKQRGALIVGVKTDYPPFGMLNSSGQPEGFEHDLAADIAKRLGVRLTKVGVSASNRLQKLQEGVVDMVLATTGDTEDRRRIVTMIEPDYYASGVTVFMPPRENARDWADIRGKTVCATQGSYFNRTMQQRYLLDLQIYNSARDAKLAVKDGRCIGYLFDNTAVMSDLANPEWKGYKATLSPALVTPWAIAVSAREQGREFEVFLGDVVAEWHRSGFLIEREKAWNIPPSKYLADTHELWKKTEASGRPFCHRLPEGKWNSECRNKVFLTSTDVGGLAQLGLWLSEKTGVDLTIIYDPYDRMQFIRGVTTTLLLTALCILGSLAFGIVGAVCAESRVFLVAPLSMAACTVGRMTPPFLVMYLVLFGIGSLFGVSLSSMVVVVWCLCMYTGAGVMTAFLDAAAAIRRERPEYRLGVSNSREVVRLASGSVTATLINVSKATMMASAFAVPELMSSATVIINERGNVGVMMNVLLVTFFLIVYGVVRLLRHFERLVLARGG